MSYNVKTFNPKTGKWEDAVPMRYHYSLFPWAWRRVTGWRDTYGRKAALWWGN